MNIQKSLFQKVCKSIHSQLAPSFGNYFKADFDNRQEVVQINDSLETVRTYEEVGLEQLSKKFKHIKKLILTSTKEGVNFKMIVTRKGEDIIGMSLNYHPDEIYGTPSN